MDDKVVKCVELHSCRFCNKVFTTHNGITRHEKIHIIEKPFCCGNCGQVFKTRAHLVHHQRIHTGERPYSCETCGISFPCMNTLNRHKIAHVRMLSETLTQVGTL